VLALEVPWAPRFFGPQLDSSWELALHTAFAAGRRFGEEVVFSFGPWGFAYSGTYFPATFGLTLGLWILFAVAFWAAALELVRAALTQSAVALLWLLALVVAASASPEAFLGTLPALFLLAHFGSSAGPGPASRILLPLAMAWAALVKFTFFVPAAGVVGLVALHDVIGRRRMPVPALVFAAAVPVLWVAAGQQPADLATFVRRSGELAAGYTEAMMLSGPKAEILATLAATTLVLALVARVEWFRAGGWGVVPLLGVTFLVHLAVKGAFVRHDGHALRAAFKLLVIVLVYALAPEARTRARALLVTAGVASVALAWVLLRHWAGTGLPGYVGGKAALVGRRVAAAARLVRGDAELAAGYAASLAAVRAEQPLPRLDGPVDVYPWSASVAVAHGLDYRPRPVFQSYAAFTPALADLNARYLRGPQAPRSVLFDLLTIDGRFPTLDDGPSWPDLLALYDVSGVTRSFLVLARRERPRPVVLEPIADVAATTGVPLELPDAGTPLYARIDVEPTLLGRLATLVLKPPTVYATVTLRRGGTRTFTLVPAMARGGFLLSPLVADRLDWAALAAAGSEGAALDGNRVVAVRIDPGRGERFYRRDVRVSLARLRFPGQDLASLPSLRAAADLRSLLAAEVRAGTTELKTGGDGAGVLLAHAPATIAVPVAAGATRIRLGFGLLDGAWSGGGATDGVEFRLSAPADGGSVPLWSRTLDPAARAADRGPQEAVVTLGAAHPQELLLETLPRATPLWDWSYWSAAAVVP
jgi:hypothetical protein